MNDARVYGRCAAYEAGPFAGIARALGIALVVGVAVCAVACSQSSIEPEGSTESFLEAVDVASGTELVTTSELNLRSGAGTEFGILLVLPVGARVTVASPSGASGWVNVTYQGTTGFASGKYLEKAGAKGDYSKTRGALMANRALALWNGRYSRGLCLAGVDDTAESAGAMPPGVGWIPRQPSAVAWQNYVNANPGELLKRGYVRQDRDLDNLPKGSILGWRAGQCGYHSQYGHIEIVVDDNSSRACSDYCGNVYKHCGKPFVYVPVEL
ncbi:MAG TPA: SH3 domain-containing protein [Labilithrix sp.]|jgi:hypothetical protein|nr:SH3 domain-containing protein [Labilithrix sp.]